MSDAQHETPKAKSAGRGIRIALFVSLALNLLIIGAVAGIAVVSADRRSPSVSPGLRAIGLGPILPALSQEDRRELGERIRASRDRLAAESRPLGEAVRAFTTALRAEPFDRDAAESALLSQRSHGAALQAEGHSLLLDQIETMDPAARDEFASRIEAALQRAISRGGAGDRHQN